MNKKLLIFFILLTLIPFTSALELGGSVGTGTSNVQESVAPNGLIIAYPANHYIQLNQTNRFDFRVFNSSNGVPINSGITCNYDLSNSTGY